MTALCIYGTCNRITSHHIISYTDHTLTSRTRFRHDITITRFSRKRNRKTTSKEKIAPKIPEPRIQLTECVCVCVHRLLRLPAIYYVETKHCLRYHYKFLFVVDVGIKTKNEKKKQHFSFFYRYTVYDTKKQKCTKRNDISGGVGCRLRYLLYICWEIHHGNRYSNYPQNHTWLVSTWFFLCWNRFENLFRKFESVFGGKKFLTKYKLFEFAPVGTMFLLLVGILFLYWWW